MKDDMYPDNKKFREYCTLQKYLDRIKIHGLWCNS